MLYGAGPWLSDEGKSFIALTPGGESGPGANDIKLFYGRKL
jgi:hypothetical protein